MKKTTLNLFFVICSFMVKSQTFPVTVLSPDGEQKMLVSYDSLFEKKSSFFPANGVKTVDLKIFDQQFILLKRDKPGTEHIFEYVQKGTISVVRSTNANGDWYLIKEGNWFKISGTNSSPAQEDQLRDNLIAIVKQFTQGCDAIQDITELNYAFVPLNDLIKTYNQSCGVIAFHIDPELPFYADSYQSKKHNLVLNDSTRLNRFNVNTSNIEAKYWMGLKIHIPSSEIARVDGKTKERMNEENLILNDLQRGHIALLATFDNLNSPVRLFIEKDGQIHELINSKKQHLEGYVYSKEYIGTLNVLLGDKLSYQEIVETPYQHRDISRLVSKYNSKFPESEIKSSKSNFGIKMDMIGAFVQRDAGDFEYTSITKLPVDYRSLGAGISFKAHTQNPNNFELQYSLGFFHQKGDGSMLPLYGEPYHIDYNLNTIRQNLIFGYKISIGQNLSLSPLIGIGLDHQINNKSTSLISYNDKTPTKANWPEESILKTDFQFLVGANISWENITLTAARQGMNRSENRDGVYTRVINGEENFIRLTYYYQFK